MQPQLSIDFAKERAERECRTLWFFFGFIGFELILLVIYKRPSYPILHDASTNINRHFLSFDGNSEWLRIRDELMLGVSA